MTIYKDNNVTFLRLAINGHNKFPEFSFAHNSHFDWIKTIIAVNGEKLAEKFSYYFIYCNKMMNLTS